MKGLTWYKPVFALLLVGVLLLGTTACTSEAKELMMAWFEDWMQEKDVGWVSVGARWGLGISTGNEDADAAIDSGKAIKAIKEAEDLMGQARQAREEGSLNTAADKMDQAIKTRPKDWTYHTERMALAIEQGDVTKAEQERVNALMTFDFSGKGANRSDDYDNQMILALEQTRERVEGSIFFPRSYEQCYKLYNELRISYDGICQRNPNNKGACLAAQDYEAKMDQCQIYRK